LAYAELADSPYRSWVTANTNVPKKPWTAIIKWYESWYDKEIDNGDGTYRKQPELSSSGWQPYYHAFEPTHWQPLPDPPALSLRETTEHDEGTNG
jgi:hypothetical protein